MAFNGHNTSADSLLQNTLRDLKKLPKLIVFDLDYTLWPFYSDCEREGPLKQNDVKEIQIAVASKSSNRRLCNELINAFGWNNVMKTREIHPGCKRRHFADIHTATGIEYSDMIFYDDESPNMLDIGPLGVTCVLLGDGLTEKTFIEGLMRHAFK